MKGHKVVHCLKNKGSAVRFCLWPLITMQYKKYHFNRLLKEFKNRLKGSDSSLEEYKYLDIVEQAVKDNAIFKIFFDKNIIIL